MQARFSKLWPQPRALTPGDASCTVRGEPVIRLVSPSDGRLASARRLQRELVRHGLSPRLLLGHGPAATAAVEIVLDVNPALSAKPQGYRMVIEEKGITVIAPDDAGLLYGICTLMQIATSSASAEEEKLVLPACRIDDWPDFLHRGVMLDVSRDKVPTMATLFELVEMLANSKVNQL